MPKKSLTPKTEKKVIEKIVFTSLSISELREKAVKLRREIVMLGLQIKIGRQKNVRKVFSLRKELARVLSVLNAKIATDNENN